MRPPPIPPREASNWKGLPAPRVVPSCCWRFRGMWNCLPMSKEAWVVNCYCGYYWLLLSSMCGWTCWRWSGIEPISLFAKGLKPGWDFIISSREPSLPFWFTEPDPCLERPYPPSCCIIIYSSYSCSFSISSALLGSLSNFA